VIPIQPASSSFPISLRTSSGESVKRTVQRRQFPMTLGYALTDYRAQGQTIPYVIIARPPSGKLDLFNLYVALSRSRGRHSVRLLRDFDDHIFLASHDTNLMQEDDRLERLDDVTKTWWQNMTVGI
jgi:ATP-dependent exoDNAse (exonuclease V) alpha subunit